MSKDKDIPDHLLPDDDPAFAKAAYRHDQGQNEAVPGWVTEHEISPGPAKTLPHSLEAERAVLGAVLLENDRLTDAHSLEAEDFFLESHQIIFAAMRVLFENGSSIDYITLREELRRVGKIERVPGSYISSLVDGIPIGKDISSWVKIVKDKSLRRRLIHEASQTMSRALDEQEPTDQIIQAALTVHWQLADSTTTDDLRHVKDILKDTVQSLEELYSRKQLITGIETGFTKFDELTAGLQPTDLIVIAARPGLGKTAWCLNVAGHAGLRKGKSVAIFSLEMSKRQVALRLVCSESRVDSHRLRTGYLSKEDWGKISQGLGDLAESKIFIDDTSGITVEQLLIKAKRQKKLHGLDLVIVDYLQLMGMSLGIRFENRTQEVTHVSKRLKAIAKDLEVPVIAVSQLTREPERRTGDHRPRLADLRESGSIEQDADVVAFIYREDIFNPSDDNRGVAEMIIAKQRNGPTDSFKMAFLEQYTKFENLWEE